MGRAARQSAVRRLTRFAIATGTTLGAIVAVSYSLYDSMILGHDMFGHLMPAVLAGVLGAVVGALVGLGAGALLTRIRAGPNDSSE